MTWDPDRYLQFKGQRFQPFEDLVAGLTIGPGMRMVDLGCGTGELTARLAERSPGSDVLGVDTSDSMLDRARTLERSGLRFELRSLETVDGSWDLVFSNAAVHWIADHESLMPRLWGLVAPGGQLAVQQPSRCPHPVRRALLETAREAVFAEALNGWTWELPTLPLFRYAEILYQAGAQDIRVWENVYPHELENADAMVNWTRGTAVLPYLDRLPQALHESFVQSFRDKVATHYPGSPVMYGFQRTFMTAVRPA